MRSYSRGRTANAPVDTACRGRSAPALPFLPLLGSSVPPPLLTAQPPLTQHLPYRLWAAVSQVLQLQQPLTPPFPLPIFSISILPAALGSFTLAATAYPLSQGVDMRDVFHANAHFRASLPATQQGGSS